MTKPKPEIQPDSVLNDLRWKSMAAVGDFLRLRTLPRQLHPGHAVYVTTPYGLILLRR